jgi:hypothetical protein
MRIFTLFSKLLLGCAALAGAAEMPIREIAIVHLSHTDFGFTDHPAVFADLQRRYLDIALDAALATRTAPPGERFVWTAESMAVFDDWWKSAAPLRRNQMIEAIRAGQIDVAALPLNNTPFLNREEWDQMLHWIPGELWTRLRPRVAVQNDVNGFPRAGVVRLLDRGVTRLSMGLNADSGGPPFPQPAAFWWKMPDGRRMFVWLGESYPAGYGYFEPGEWRRGPVPRASDTAYHPPRPGEVLPPDEPSVRAAHARCRKRLQRMVRAGYPHNFLIVSMTNQWRMDNDPPLPSLPRFVSAWNRLGLQPVLRLMTTTGALEKMEREAGATVPEYSGEWTDWWANGTASGPREVSASRMAKRRLRAAASPVFGPLPDAARSRAEEMWKNLALFDEHTWGSSNSLALPGDLDVAGQYNEKSRLAYRPLARAEWLLSQRVRTLLGARGAGLYAVNPTAAPVSGWASLNVTALRDNYKSVEDPSTGARAPIEFDRGLQAFVRPKAPEDLSPENPSSVFPNHAPRRVAKIWIEALPPNSVRALRLSTAETSAATAETAPEVKLDAGGWPISVAWKGMSKPLFLPGTGDFLAVTTRAFAPRWALKDLGQMRDAVKRDAARTTSLEETRASAAAATEIVETTHTMVYRQQIRHPRLRYGARILEIWKHTPRARLTLRLDRLSSLDPEAWFVDFPLPVAGAMPRVSSGGMPFTPYTEQLPNTCQDYFAIDGWVQYETAHGSWTWVSRDAPLVTFGEHNVLARRTTAPPEAHRVLAMLYNNIWYTNFLASTEGMLEFQFDLAWSAKPVPPERVEAFADALTTDPLVYISPGVPDEPLYIQRLFQP